MRQSKWVRTFARLAGIDWHMSNKGKDEPQDRSSHPSDYENFHKENAQESKTNLSTLDPALINLIDHPANISGAQKVHQNLNPNNTIQKMREFHGENSIFEAQPITLPGEKTELSSISCDAYSSGQNTGIESDEDSSSIATREQQEELMRAAQKEINEYYSGEHGNEQSMLKRYKKFTVEKEKEFLSDPLIGTTLDNKYKITGIVGSGNIATVYKAIQLSNNQVVAIKTIRNKGIEEIWRFNLEIEIMRKMNQRNLVRFIDCVKLDRGRIFLVLELVSGICLNDVLKIHGPISDEETIWFVLDQICDALIHAHSKKVIHRDLKTGNIVLSKQIDGPLLVKVLDFGLAKHKDAEAAKITVHGKTLGSPLYMSPEQCRGEEPNNQSDIYSLGILGYEMLTGIVPFIGETIVDVMHAHCDPSIKPIPLTEVCPDIKGVQQLDQIISKALEPDPSKRYLKVERFKQSLGLWIRGVRSGQWENNQDLKKVLNEDSNYYSNVNSADQSVLKQLGETLQMKLDSERSKSNSNRKKLIALIIVVVLAIMAAVKILFS